MSSRTVRNIVTSAIVSFILSVAGMALWLFEVIRIKGWHGLNWLHGHLYSPYVAALLAFFAFIVPFIAIKQVASVKMIFPVFLLYIVNIFCFEAGRQVCYALYGRYYFWDTKELVLFLSFAFILYLFLALAYWFVANKLIKKNRKINILLIMLFTMLSIPLSLLAIRINTGFGMGVDWVDAVKMGYPIFWTTMALGLSGIIIASQKS